MFSVDKYYVLSSSNTHTTTLNSHSQLFTTHSNRPFKLVCFVPILFSYFRPRDVNPENSVSLKCGPMYVHL